MRFGVGVGVGVPGDSWQTRSHLPSSPVLTHPPGNVALSPFSVPGWAQRTQRYVAPCPGAVTRLKGEGASNMARAPLSWNCNSRNPGVEWGGREPGDGSDEGWVAPGKALRPS